MEDDLPADFVLPVSIGNGIYPWRAWACDFILGGSAQQNGMISRTTPSERATLDLEVFPIPREAEKLNVSARALASLLYKLAAQEAMDRADDLDK
jgi:hypothetical protein